MWAAWYHIVKKNGWLLILFLLLFCGAKYRSVQGVQNMHDRQLPSLQKWLEECTDMEAEERAIFIEELATTVYTGEIEDGGRSYTELYKTYRNAQTVENFIRFAREGKGESLASMPVNYLDILDFYKELTPPTMIDEGPLRVYWSLQNNSIVFILVIFLCAVFFGQYYETGLYQYAAVTAEGRSYRKTFQSVLLGICLLFLIGNELFDGLYSGILTDSRIWQASLQSYSAFYGAEINVSIGTCFLLLCISKVAGTVMLYQLACLIAGWKKNVKDTLIACVFVVLLLFFAGQSFGTYVQVGCVNWETVIKGTLRQPGALLSSLSIGILLTVGGTVAVWGLSYWVRRRKNT